MKTIYTLSLLVLMSINLFAQNITKNPSLHKKSNKDTIKLLYDSICEWDGVPFGPPPGSPPNVRTFDFVYDANQNLLSDIEQEGYTNPLQNAVKTINTYYSNNLTSNTIIQYWGTNWVNHTQTNYTYTSFDSLKTVKTQQWKSNAWVDTSITTYNYNLNNTDSSTLTQAWNGSAWVNSNINLYYYNANNLDTCYLNQTWNGTSWVNSSRYLYWHNANDSDTCIIHQTWIDSTASWANNSKYNYFYNANNFDTLTIASFWWCCNTWTPYYKYFYSYDTNNNLTYFSYWDGNAGWIILGQTYYTYDIYNRMVTNLSNFRPTHYDNIYYYYGTGISGTQISPAVPIYPNPNNGTFTIDNNAKSYTNCRIDVYNMLGQDVYKTTCANFNAPSQISLTDPNGIYILRFLSDQGNSYRKLVIKN